MVELRMRVLAEFLAVDLEQPGSSSLEVQLLASSISSVLRAALNVAMQTGEDVHELIQRAFDLLGSGRIAGLLIRRPMESQCLNGLLKDAAGGNHLERVVA